MSVSCVCDLVCFAILWLISSGEIPEDTLSSVTLTGTLSAEAETLDTQTINQIG